MTQYVFPAVFIKNEDETYSVLVPDLELTTDGNTIEEAYLFIKDYLRIFCEYAVKMDEELLVPTKYEKICEQFKNNIVMLIDAVV